MMDRALFALAFVAALGGKLVLLAALFRAALILKR